MSEALIASLNARVTELTSQNANLNAALKEARRERKAADDGKAELKAQADKLAAERDELKTKLESAPNELRGKIVELESAIKARDHKDAFKAAAIEAGVSAKAVDDLYALSGLKPGDGPVDPAEFAEALATAKEARPWAFDGEQQSPSQGQGAPPQGGSQSIRLAAVPPPSGGGRGASDLPSTKFRVTSADLADGAWMQANQESVAKASAEGRLEVV